MSSSPGGWPLPLVMYVATVDSATSIPSISSSPWICGAPHSAFSLLIRRMRSRMSRSILGRPQHRRDFQRQYARKPHRYERITFSGLTTMIAFRIAGKHRYGQTQINRSMFRSRARDGALRLRTITC